MIKEKRVEALESARWPSTRPKKVVVMDDRNKTVEEYQVEVLLDEYEGLAAD